MPSVRVFSDLSRLSQYAASQFDRLAEEAVSERGRFLTALSGGSTPEGLYRLLGQPPYNAKTWWNDTHLFWGDERCVPPDDPESCYGQVRRLLLGLVEIPSGQVHRVRGEMPPAEAAVLYQQELAGAAGPGLVYPRFDLVLLGMGTDGHTASLFPGSIPDVSEPALAVTGQYESRPARRVTLSPRVFNEARQVFFMAVGANKAGTLLRVLTAPLDELNLPAQRIRPSTGQVTWLVDEAAASQLPESLKIRVFI